MSRLGLATIVLMGAWTGILAPVAAQSNTSVDQFDLILVGDQLSPAVHQVELRTNPTQGGSWTSPGETRCAEVGGVLVIPDRASARYYGQDRRENHLSLRITTTGNVSQGRLRAAYAVPHDDWTNANCTQLARLVRSDPQTVRRYSLATYERPRPARLTSEEPFIDHIEAPIRHRRPGVMEVEWLNILFR